MKCKLFLIFFHFHLQERVKGRQLRTALGFISKLIPFLFRFFTFKRDSFCDFLFTFQHTNPILKKKVYSKEKVICFQTGKGGGKFVSL